MEITRPTTLLPSGMVVLIPPESEQSAAIVNRMLTTLGQWGYQQVIPPIMEYKQSQDSDTSATEEPAFTIMDPVTQKLLTIRSDITKQVAKLARGRLAELPRPLRLSYTGAVIRSQHQANDPLRERRQIGAELFAPATAAADQECLLLASDCLEKLAIENPYIVITYPEILRRWLAKCQIDQAQTKLITQALANQQLKSLNILATNADPKVQECIQALEQWLAISYQQTELEQRWQSYRQTVIGATVAPRLAQLQKLLQKMQKLRPNITWRLDLAEATGFVYQQGFCFSIFSSNSHLELGRGGRYCWHDEPAAGFSFYVDALLQITKINQPRPRIYLPWQFRHQAEKLRQQGMIVVAALASENRREVAMIARQLNCQAIYQHDNKIIEI